MPATIPMSIAEVADRYTIALLKLGRLPDEPPGPLGEQIQHYAAGLDPTDPAINGAVLQLLQINGQIWDAEASIRNCSLTDLTEIGRLAVLVRDLNKTRCSVKNAINRLTKTGFDEVKVNYGVAH